MNKPMCSNCGGRAKRLMRTWCKACYGRWWKAGKPEGGPPLLYVIPPACGDCGIPFRATRHKAHGMCATCYQRFRRARVKVLVASDG